MLKECIEQGIKKLDSSEKIEFVINIPKTCEIF